MDNAPGSAGRFAGRAVLGDRPGPRPHCLDVGLACVAVLLLGDFGHPCAAAVASCLIAPAFALSRDQGIERVEIHIGMFLRVVLAQPS